MDIQKKKIKMADILPSDENEKSVVLNQKLALKKEIIKPIIQPRNVHQDALRGPLADIAVNPHTKQSYGVGVKENAEKKEDVEKHLSTEDASIAEIKNITVGIDKKTKTIEHVAEILKKTKEEPLLLQEKKSFSFKKYIIYFLIILIAASALYVAIYILPRAEIIIITKKSVWDFNDIVRASKDTSNINLADKQIPAEIFKDIKTLTLSFPAHGKKYVERKAVGEVMIYNSYSSQPQSLIAGTRIESPDGKIFRLDKKTTVPGAKIEEGKIAASGIKATVTAEKTGEEYNIAPVNKFTIPGFKGTVKYDGFYAVSNESMKGGLVGDILFPTEEDILVAKEKTSAQLSEDINTFLSSQFSGDFKILEWSKVFNLTKENIDKEADRNGNFLVTFEGEMKIISFRESDILELMSKMAKETLGPTFEIKNYNLNYGIGQYDADNGKIAFSIKFNGEFWQPINIENFKNSIINKKENDLKIFVFSIPGVEKATFSLWPGWIRKVPDSTNKIKVNIN